MTILGSHARNLDPSEATPGAVTGKAAEPQPSTGSTVRARGPHGASGALGMG